jgi:hypothetical protein
MAPKDNQRDRTLQSLLDRLNASVSSLPLGGRLTLPGEFQVAGRAGTPTIISLPGVLSQKIAALFNEPDWRNSERHHFSYFNELIKQQIATPEPDLDNRWSGRSIQGYLAAVRELLENELASLAGRYSSAQWLWYLRRLPDFIWLGRVSTTAPYDVTLAEIISSKSVTHSKFEIKGYKLEYPLGKGAVDHICKFCTGVRYLSQLHTYIRWAGKGVQFVSDNLLIVRPAPTREEREAVGLYDQRVSTSGESFIGRIGSIVTDKPTNGCQTNIFAAFRQPKTEPRETYLGALLKNPQKTSVLSRFVCDLPCLDELAALNQRTASSLISWWTEDVGPLILLLRLCISFINHNEYDLIRSARYGWLITDEAGFVDIPADYWDDAVNVARILFPGISLPPDGHALLAALEQMEARHWPPRPGPPIRREGKYLFIDVAAATNLLHQRLEFRAAGGGEAGNLRAAHFEAAVQAIIDDSPWAPSPELREKVGKPVRYQGQRKTDLDAIGVRGSSLLLVQCKSRVYSGEYDIGDYQAVRQGVQLVRDAVLAWTSFRDFIHKHPSFDNFDFSKYSEIICTVCTPHVVYVPIGPAMSFVAPGLRAAISVPELHEWLNRRSA